MDDLKAGVYHYKGKPYLLLGVGRMHDTDELMVVYVALYEDVRFMEGPAISITTPGRFKKFEWVGSR